MKGDHCPCIASSHGHEPNHCDEPEPPTGAGVCVTCRYTQPEKMDPEELAAAVRSSNLTFTQRVAIYRLIEGAKK